MDRWRFVYVRTRPGATWHLRLDPDGALRQSLCGRRAAWAERVDGGRPAGAHCAACDRIVLTKTFH